MKPWRWVCACVKSNNVVVKSVAEQLQAHFYTSWKNISHHRKEDTKHKKRRDNRVCRQVAYFRFTWNFPCLYFHSNTHEERVNIEYFCRNFGNRRASFGDGFTTLPWSFSRVVLYWETHWKSHKQYQSQYSNGKT